MISCINNEFIIIILQFIWLFSVTQLSPVTYGKYEYPSWAIAFGWMLGIVSLVPLPVCAIIAIVKEEGPLIEVSDRKIKFIHNQ